jgi:glycosyltransferase involved in cell wall biosynthesis
MPHVVWLFEYPTLNGGERSLLAMLPALRAAGYQVSAAGPRGGPLAEALAEAKIPLRPMDWRDGKSARRPLTALRAELKSLLGSLPSDLLHANSLSMGRLAGPVAAELGLPSLAHIRDIVGLNATALADLAQNTRLLAVSHATRDFHAGQGLPGDKVEVLYNGVDLDRFRPRLADGRLHAEWGIPRHCVLIGTIGQIIQRKGLDVLAAAATSLADRLPHVHFVIVGQRYSRKDETIAHERTVKQQLTTGGLAGRAHFLGERRDVPDLLPELTLLVHPARQEPLGRVLLEAAACGVPIVATDVGGTREIFRDIDGSRTACLVPANDPAALAAAIETVVSDEDLRSQLARAARRRAEAVFDIRQAAACLAEHYKRAIDAQGAATPEGSAAPSCNSGSG